VGELQRALQAPWGRSIARALAENVLPRSGATATGARELALELLLEGRWRVAVPSLLSVARSEADPLRARVLLALPAFEDEAVDTYLVRAIAKSFDKRHGPHPFNLLLERIRGDTPLGERASVQLVARLAQMFLSTDWRDASRACVLSRGLEPSRAVPLLIDGLSAWNRRGRLGVGSLRVQNEIAAELRLLSGRTIGLDPDAWTTWWIAVRQGRIPLTAEAGARPAEASGTRDGARTQASFFGLRPVSDHVTFIIDHSGSMSTGWGTRGWSRFVEAVDQMMRYLQAAGERTHFDVILFSDQPVRSNERMLLATPANLERLRASLLQRKPDGSTCLKPAVLAALAMGETEGIDYERLEADTIIVLCDGETAEGPLWVAPLLERVGAESRVQFHCVLMGGRDDGALSSLAEGTGGEFLRIGG
jgi:hypothetical protein